MARGIQDIGNGYGYVYQTAVDGSTITDWCPNVNQEVNNFKPKGNVAAPFASKKSAYGTMTLISSTGTGSVTDLQVNGVSIIPAPIIIDGLSLQEIQVLLALAVNGYTPVSGPKYQAAPIEAKLLLLAPPSYGATPNGFAIVLSDSGGVFSYSTEAFANGSGQSGVYDSVAGARYFLNADYGSTGTSGETPASPTSLTNAIEITKYFVTRGQNLGIITKTINAITNAIIGVDRSGFMTKINIIPQSGITETVVFISPEDFVDGDFVVLQANNSSDTITVESVPAVTVPVTGNIRLTSDTPWVSSAYTALLLQYRFIDGIGGTFMEVSRSLSQADVIPPDIMIGKTIVVSSLGSDATAIPYDLNKHYSTFDAALSAATSGDTVVVYPGSWTCTNVMGISSVDNLSIFMHPGATISGGAMFKGFRSGFKIAGCGDLVSTGLNDFGNDGGTPVITLIQCNTLKTGLTTNTAGGGLRIECATSFTVEATTDPLGAPIFSMIGSVASVYNVKIITPDTFLNISAGGSPSGIGIWLQALPEGSYFEVIGNITNRSRVLVQSIILYNVAKSTVRITGIINDPTLYFDGSTSGTGDVVAAQDSLDWGTGLEGYGFYITGAIYTKDRKAIRLSSGKLDFRGDIVDFSEIAAAIPYSIEITKSASTLASTLYLSNGKAVYPAANGALFRYANQGTGSSVGNIIRFSNYVAIANQFLGYSDDSPANYQVLSAYSNVAADATVLNSITGTTLIVDAALT